MAKYQTKLGDRDLDHVEITMEEAREMYLAGFAFSIFNEESLEFNLTRPYKLVHNLDRGTLTFIQ